MPSAGARTPLTQKVSLDDAVVEFEIWDTAGQERYRSLAPMYYRGAAAAIVAYDITSPVSRYRSLAPMYYRGAAAAIVAYDITSPESFAGARSWVRELRRRGEEGVVIAMAGNKADLGARRRVDPAEAEAYAAENGILHMETSAKDVVNVRDLFAQVARRIPRATPRPEREARPLAKPKGDSQSCC